MNELTIQINAAPDSVVQYGLSRLQERLTQAGTAVRIVHGAEPSGGTYRIDIGTGQGHTQRKPGGRGGADEVDLGREGFVSDVSRRARRRSIVSAGSVGALYGLLDAADAIDMAGGNPAGLFDDNGVHHKVPAVRYRGAKCNLPWESYQLGGSTELNDEVYWDLEVWRRYLDRLVDARYNLLTLWSEYPYEKMIPLWDACEPGSPAAEQAAIRTEFWKSVFAMAAERGMDVFLLTWNIHLSEESARRLEVPRSAWDMGIIREHLYECVRGVLETYEGLTGFGTVLGERMYGLPDEAYYRLLNDVYVRAIVDSGRDIPFMLRSTWLSPEMIRTLAEQIPDSVEVLVDWKYNTSHGLSTPQLIGAENNPILNPGSDRYHMLFHVRNEEAYILQWGDPEYVREHISCQQELGNHVGYFFGSERVLPFAERVRRSQDGTAIQTYDFERRWYLYAIWGRLGYDPETPRSYWQTRLNEHYGLPVRSAALYDALAAASQVVLLVNRWWRLSWDAAIYAEGSLGIPPGGDWLHAGSGQRFISIKELMVHSTQDPAYLSIPEFYGRLPGDQLAPDRLILDDADHVSPIELARTLERESRRIRSLGERCRRALNVSTGRETEWLLDDIDVWSRLAGIYAIRIKAATFLFGWMLTANSAFKRKAASLARKALAAWRDLSQFTESRYATQRYDALGEFHWALFEEDMANDVETCRTMPTLAELVNETAWWTGAAGPVDRSRDSDAETDPTIREIHRRWRDLDTKKPLDGWLHSTEGPEREGFESRLDLSPQIDEAGLGNPNTVARELRKRFELIVDFNGDDNEPSDESAECAYAVCVYRTTNRRVVPAEILTRDPVRVWVNGAEVFRTPRTRFHSDPRHGGWFALELKKGANLVVIRSVRTLPRPAGVEADRTDPLEWAVRLRVGYSMRHFFRHHEVGGEALRKPYKP